MDKIREKFEAGICENSSIVFNGEEYTPADKSRYAENVAAVTTLGFNEFKRGYEAAKVSQWISVEDELPENATWVLIYTYSELTERRIVTMAFFESSNDELFWLSSRSDVDGWDRVTHWMPLPKGQNDE